MGDGVPCYGALEIVGLLLLLLLMTCVAQMFQQVMIKCAVHKDKNRIKTWLAVNSCFQPVLKPSTGPHPFFIYQQTPEADYCRYVAAFCIACHILPLK